MRSSRRGGDYDASEATFAERERSSSNSVCDSADGAAEVQVRVIRVFLGGVKSEHDVSEVARPVRNIQRHQAGAAAAQLRRDPGTHDQREPMVVDLLRGSGHADDYRSRT